MSPRSFVRREARKTNTFFFKIALYRKHGCSRRLGGWREFRWRGGTCAELSGQLFVELTHFFELPRNGRREDNARLALKKEKTTESVQKRGQSTPTHHPGPAQRGDSRGGRARRHWRCPFSAESSSSTRAVRKTGGERVRKKAFL